MALHARLDNGLLTQQQRFAEFDRRNFLKNSDFNAASMLSDIKPYQTQSNFKKSYEIKTFIESNLHQPPNYKVPVPEFKGTIVPQVARTDQRFEAPAVGWGIERERMIDHSGTNVKSCSKNTLREWDRYNNEVYVYGLGK